MRKLNKIFLILVITFLLTNIFNEVYAIPHTVIPETDTGAGKDSTIMKINPDDYEPTGPTRMEANTLTSKVGRVLGFIRNLSVAVSVIVLMVIGVKYMLGSVEEKANYKASMMPYIIGCIMAVSGSVLVSFIYNVIH